MILKPPHPNRYFQRCMTLQRMLHTQNVVPIIVVEHCRMVLSAAFGSDLRMLAWLTLRSMRTVLRHRQEDLWQGWQKYVRLRTEDEIQELMDQRVEKMIGVDIREWPDVVDDEGER